MSDLSYPGGLRPDRRTQEVSLQSVSFVVMLWNVELFALLCAHRFLFPVSVVFLLFLTFCPEGGTPKGSRGRPGTAFGQSVLNDAICGHFWSHFWTPFGTLGVKVATPGAPLAPPWAPLALLLRPFLQSVLHGCYFGCQGCRAGAPRGWKCG